MTSPTSRRRFCTTFRSPAETDPSPLPFFRPAALVSATPTPTDPAARRGSHEPLGRVLRARVLRGATLAALARGVKCSGAVRAQVVHMGRREVCVKPQGLVCMQS